MQEFMRLKYLSVTKILSPNLKSARLSLSYLDSFYRRHGNGGQSMKNLWHLKEKSSF